MRGVLRPRLRARVHPRRGPPPAARRRFRGPPPPPAPRRTAPGAPLRRAPRPARRARRRTGHSAGARARRFPPAASGAPPPTPRPARRRRGRRARRNRGCSGQCPRKRANSSARPAPGRAGLRHRGGASGRGWTEHAGRAGAAPFPFAPGLELAVSFAALGVAGAKRPSPSAGPPRRGPRPGAPAPPRSRPFRVPSTAARSPFPSGGVRLHQEFAPPVLPAARIPIAATERRPPLFSGTVHGPDDDRSAEFVGDVFGQIHRRPEGIRTKHSIGEQLATIVTLDTPFMSPSIGQPSERHRADVVLRSPLLLEAVQHETGTIRFGVFDFARPVGATISGDSSALCALWSAGHHLARFFSSRAASRGPPENAVVKSTLEVTSPVFLPSSDIANRSIRKVNESGALRVRNTTDFSRTRRRWSS